VTYYVQFGQEVRDYIEAVEGLSAAGRDALMDGVTEELGRDVDEFLRTRPLSPESLHFRYDYVQPDDQTLYIFDFVVDATQMEVGVVTVVYAECTLHRAG